MASAVAAAAAWLPWVRSGARRRDLFEVVRAAEVLGAADRTLVRSLLWACALLPMLVAVAWLATLTNRSRIAAFVSIGVGGIAVAAGAAVVAAPVPTETGPAVSAGAGTVAILGGIWLAGKRSGT